MSCRPPRKRSRCSCGTKWSISRMVVEYRDGTTATVDGYWCKDCDGRASGEGVSPLTHGR